MSPALLLCTVKFLFLLFSPHAPNKSIDSKIKHQVVNCFFCIKEMQNPLPLPLNPDPDSKKVYLNKDGSGVVVTLANRIGQFFSFLGYGAGAVVLIFLVFCVVVCGGARGAHLFSFLCCKHRKLKGCAPRAPPNTTTQKTKKMSNTDPTKYHNTEN
jgi:hypothetical protein